MESYLKSCLPLIIKSTLQISFSPQFSAERTNRNPQTQGKMGILGGRMGPLQLCSLQHTQLVALRPQGFNSFLSEIAAWWEKESLSWLDHKLSPPLLRLS